MTGGWFRLCPVPNSRCSSFEQILRTLTVASDERHIIRLRLPDLVE